MAGMMQAPTRRFLFLRTARKASLAPIYLVLLGIVSLALIGLLAALWAPASELPAQARGEERPAGDSRSFEGSYRPAPSPAPPKSRRPGTWM